mmetsp:Transcript_17727/g.51558  ORF Transcript_17727/g.51558 Transcript_17727/m.51558 type:complete len:315 (+) Transcript_17727:974-1918(+)
MSSSPSRCLPSGLWRWSPPSARACRRGSPPAEALSPLPRASPPSWATRTLTRCSDRRTRCSGACPPQTSPSRTCRAPRPTPRCSQSLRRRASARSTPSFPTAGTTTPRPNGKRSKSGATTSSAPRAACPWCGGTSCALTRTTSTRASAACRYSSPAATSWWCSAATPTSSASGAAWRSSSSSRWAAFRNTSRSSPSDGASARRRMEPRRRPRTRTSAMAIPCSTARGGSRARSPISTSGAPDASWTRTATACSASSRLPTEISDPSTTASGECSPPLPLFSNRRHPPCSRNAPAPRCGSGARPPFSPSARCRRP